MPTGRRGSFQRAFKRAAQRRTQQQTGQYRVWLPGGLSLNPGLQAYRIRLSMYSVGAASLSYSVTPGCLQQVDPTPRALLRRTPRSQYRSVLRSVSLASRCRAAVGQPLPLLANTIYLPLGL
jgi:hypothetical protein